MKADLHVHSTASDGTLEPEALVEHAHERGVDVLALADHDSVGGAAEARGAAIHFGMTLIDAVELSAVADSRDVHILAYFVDPGSQSLARLLRRLREARRARAEVMIAALNDAGYTMSFDDVLAIAAGGTLGRSHVARALMGAGHVDSIQQAFETLIGRDKPFYIRKHSASPQEVIATVRELNAIPVIAHPGITDVDDLIPEMVGAGLLGIEAYHADHTPEQMRHYADMAAAYHVLVTGGSDFHGPGAPNPDVGSVYVPVADVEALLAAGSRCTHT
jgi:3',5'-nucleoside bisphosphate phosphatase